MDLLSGPKGSPNDVRRISGWNANSAPTYVNDDANQTRSTGGLSTGIGFGSGNGLQGLVIGATAPASIKAAGFMDDSTPGVTKPDGTAATDSRLMYLGGGKMGNYSATLYGVPFPVSPYTAGFGIGAAGQSNTRDAGAGPAFTGFQPKMVTATGAVATGAAVEAGFLNRSGAALVSGQSVFGVSNVASAAVA